MKENYVGYLLGALDPATHLEVEKHVGAHPEAQRDLDLLRRGMAPLEADKDDIPSPPDLVMRTLARVAEQSCRAMPLAPPFPRSRATGGGGRRWWARADVLVAASLVLCLGLMIPPIVLSLRGRGNVVECKENLHNWGQGFLQVRDTKGEFPNVANHDDPSRRVSGHVVYELEREGFRPRNASIRCPANGTPVDLNFTPKEVQDMTPEAFGDNAAKLMPCYAYNLGYRDGGRISTAYPADQGPWPLMSDKPPSASRIDNSPNHDGRGQNVLFTDGHVKFMTSRQYRGDDFFLNRDKQVGAGKDVWDCVLGASEARP